jgi:hypothetical protein
MESIARGGFERSAASACQVSKAWANEPDSTHYAVRTSRTPAHSLSCVGPTLRGDLRGCREPIA